jgi:tRNA threonylcarbamoyladenosine biosynthesis protein TsaE
MDRVIVSRSESETEAVALDLAVNLTIGDVVLIDGDLGAGKTVFVRGLAQGLGAASAEVSSPTFTLVHEYRGGRVTLYHADLYRLDRAAVADLGLEELAAEGVLAVEWPDRFADPGPSPVCVQIDAVEEDENLRRITIGRQDDRAVSV